MLNRKTKGLFLELNEHSILAARTSQMTEPLQIEALATFPVDLDEGELKSKLQDFAQVSRGPAVACCAVYPSQRFCHRFVLEAPAKVKDPRYLSEQLKTQFDIDAATNAIAVLSGASGLAVDAEKVPQKEVAFCGAPTEALQTAQDRLLAMGIYPESLEIGTVLNLGSVCRYTQASGIDSPILLLEVSEESSQILIAQEGKLEYSRPIQSGIGQMIPQIQSRLGLKDEASARKLFQASAFDFTEIGPTLLRQTLRELQASIGYYEVNTGQTVSQFCLTTAPRHLQWIGAVVGDSLGLEPLPLDFPAWLEAQDITLGEDVAIKDLDARWLGVLGLMIRREPKKPVEAEPQTEEEAQDAVQEN